MGRPLPGDLPPVPQEASARDGYLSVQVPDNARVYVNGLATSSRGSERRYVSRGLEPGYSYSYEVRAELTRDGRTVEQTQRIQLRAGQVANMSFDLTEELSDNQPEQEPGVTTLTLHVPDDAQVYLAGTEATGSGPIRVFNTTRLAPGKQWSDYQIRVTVDRQGRTLSQERSIALDAGDSRSLTFDFDSPHVAGVR